MKDNSNLRDTTQIIHEDSSEFEGSDDPPCPYVGPQSDMHAPHSIYNTMTRLIFRNFPTLDIPRITK
ncbi:hypothetical protein ACFX11_046584 [Malus domestica]